MQSTMNFVCRPIPRTVASVLAEQMSIAVLEREREEAMMRGRGGEGDEEMTTGITLAEFMSSYYRHGYRNSSHSNKDITDLRVRSLL